MNINLQWSTEFLGAIWFDNRLQLNSYSISLQLLTNSGSPAVTNVAIERIKAFILLELTNAVFISREHEGEADLLRTMGANVCELPEDPIDQIVGIMLYCKLNAVTEKQLLITKLDISSTLGDSIWYQHDSDDNIGPFADPGWWNRSSCYKEDPDNDTENNVVKVESNGWASYGLEWPDTLQSREAKIVYSDFKKQ